MGGWTFEGYWNTVIGSTYTPESVVEEFKLVARGLDEWLGSAEEAAISAGAVDRTTTLDAWADFHDLALAKLAAAVQS